MQAFIYRHLVPAQELLASIAGFPRNLSSIRPTDNRPVQIPAGGTVSVKIRMPNVPALKELRLELDDPPPGVTLQEVAAAAEGLTMRLKADGDKAKAGFSDNLIVEMIMNRETKGADGGGSNPKQRVSLGVLPAIPITVVKQ